MSDDFDSSEEFDELEKMMNDDVPEFEDPTADPDNVSTGVISDLQQGFSANMDIERLSSKFKKSTLEALPGEMGDNIDDTLYMMDDVKDKVTENIEKTSKVFGKSLKSLSDVLPDFMAGHVKDAGQWLTGDDDYSSSREMSEDEKIQEELKNLFGDIGTSKASNEQNLELINSLSAKKNEELLANLVVNSGESLRLKYDIDNKYYRKNLELQLKQTTTLLKIFDTVNQASKTSTAQLEAIVKNTGLPDFAKNRSSDFVKQMMIQGVTDHSVDAFKNVSVISKAGTAMENFVDGKFRSFISGTEILDTLVESKKTMNEQGISSINLLADEVIGGGVEKGLDAISERVLKTMLDNEDGETSIIELNKLLSDPVEALKYLKDKHTTDGEEDFKSKTLDFMSEIVKSGLSENSYVINNDKLEDASFLDNKLKDTINIIPNILTKILAEVTTIRKGNNIVSKEDSLVYNYRTRDFETKQEQENNVIGKLEEHGERLAKATGNATIIKYLTGEDKLSLEDNKDFSSGLIEYLLKGKTISPYYLLDNGFLDNFNNTSVKRKIESRLKELTRSSKDEDMKTLSSLQNSLKRIQSKDIVNYRDIVDEAVDTTDKSIITELGITTKENANSVSFNEYSKLNKKYSNKFLEKDFVSKKEEAAKKEAEKQAKENGDKAPETTEDNVPNQGFYVGGYTGLSGKNTRHKVAGVVHEDEFVLNSKRLNQLMTNVQDNDLSSITETITNIVKDVSSEKHDKETFTTINKSIETLTDKVKNIATDSEKYFDKTLFKEEESNPYKLSNITEKTKETNKLKDVSDIYKTLSEDLGSLVTDSGKEILNIRKVVTDNVIEFTGKLPKSWDEISKGYDDYSKKIVKNIPKNMEEFNGSIDSIFNSLSSGFKTVTDLVPDNVKKIGDDLSLGFDNVIKDSNSFIEKNISKETKDSVRQFKQETEKNFNTTMKIGKNFYDDNFSNKINTTNMKFETSLNNEESKFNNFKPLKKKGIDKVTSSIDELINSMSDQFKTLTSSTEKDMTDLNKETSSSWSNIRESLNNTFTSLTDTIPLTVDNLTKLTFNDVTETIGEATGLEIFKNKKPIQGPLTLEEFKKEEYEKELNVYGPMKPEIFNDLKEKEKNKEKNKEDSNKDNFKKIETNVDNSIKGSLNKVKSLFSKVTDDSPEFMNNIREIGKIIDEDGIDIMLTKDLSKTPFPESYNDAINTYQTLFNSIDPSGIMWDNITKEHDYIENIQKIHIKVIEDKQKGLLAKGGSKLDAGLDYAGNSIGKFRDKIISSVPKPLQGPLRTLLDNRFTKYGGKTVGRIKNAFKAAGKTTLKGLKEAGGNFGDMFIGNDGRIRMPNAVDLTKGLGKTWWSSTKALSSGVKELYPELFGAAADAGKLAGSSAMDFLGVNRGIRKAKSLVKPPIERKLFKEWKDGKLTGKEVLEVLKTDKEKEKWAKWLKENDRMGFTLPEILSKTGKGYLNAVVGSRKIIRPTYSTIGKATKFGAKTIASGLWGFSGGRDLFNKKKPKLPEVKRYIDLISKNVIDIFEEDVQSISNDLEISNVHVSVLNNDVDKKSKRKRNIIRTFMGDINGKYLQYMNEDNKESLDEARSLIRDLLTYLKSAYNKKEIKKNRKLKVNGKKSKKDKIKDNVDKIVKDDISETNLDKTVKDKESIDNEKISETDTSIFGKVNNFFKDSLDNIQSVNNETKKDIKESIDKTFNTDNVDTEVKDKKDIFDNDVKKDIKESIDKTFNTDNVDTEVKDKKDIFDNDVKKEPNKEDKLDNLTDSLDNLNETMEENLGSFKKKEKKEEFSIFDRDKDGDRDGNAKDRREKLYGKDKEDVKDKKTSNNKSLAKKATMFTSILGTLALLSPETVGKAVKGITATIGFIFDTFKTIGNFFAKAYYRSKDMLSKIPFLGIDPVTKEEWQSIGDAEKAENAKSAEIKYDEDGNVIPVEESNLGDDLALSLGGGALAAGAYKLTPGNRLVTKGVVGSTKLAGKAVSSTVRGVSNVSNKIGDKLKTNKSTIDKKVKMENVNKTNNPKNNIKSAKKNDGLVKKVLKFKDKFIKRIRKNFGKKFIMKLMGRILKFFMPAAILLTIAELTYYLTWKGQSLTTAISNTIFGFDIFNDDEIPSEMKKENEIEEVTTRTTSRYILGEGPQPTGIKGYEEDEFKPSLSKDFTNGKFKSSLINDFTGDVFKPRPFRYSSDDEFIPRQSNNNINVDLKKKENEIEEVTASTTSKHTLGEGPQPTGIKGYEEDEFKPSFNKDFINSEFKSLIGDEFAGKKIKLRPFRYSSDDEFIPRQSNNNVIVISEKKEDGIEEVTTRTTSRYILGEGPQPTGIKGFGETNFKSSFSNDFINDKFKSKPFNYSPDDEFKSRPINNITYDKFKPKQSNNNIDVDSKKKDKSDFGEKEFKVGKTYEAKTYGIPKINVASSELYSPTNGLENLKVGKGVKITGLNEKLKSNLFAMANEYNDLTNKFIPINDAFRSYSDQMKMKIKYGKRAASPGNSTHEFGLAFDTNTPVANELDKLGLMKKYGFTRPVGKETWHVESAGTQLDVNGAKKNIARANDLIDFSVGKGGNGWGTVKNVRKSSRNKKFQEGILESPGVEIENKKDIADKIKKDKKLLEKQNVLNKKANVRSKTDNLSKDIKGKTTAKVKDTKPVINVDTSKFDNKKELDVINKTGGESNGILDKSLKVHAKTHDMISELVKLNRNILSELRDSKASVRNNSNNTRRYSNNLDHSNPAVSHDVNSF